MNDINKVLPEFEDASRPRYPGAFSSDAPTPFERAGGSAATGETLHNPRDPYYLIQHEKAVHRMMAYMSVRGDTNKEIAEATGYSAVAVSNILRQPATQVLLAEETKRLGGQEVMTVLRGAALKAARRILVEVDNVDTGTAQSRSAAANSVLDRVFGKAPVTVTHFDGGEVDQLSDEEIARRLKELEAQKTN